MVTKHVNRLACEIVLEHFGENVEKVCRTLLYEGQQSLLDIVRETKFSSTVVKNCLLVLTQHNCIQAVRYNNDGDHPGSRIQSQTVYIAVLSNILNRLRFPKFLLHIRSSFSVEAVSLVEGLLEHGRLTLEQMFQRAQEQPGQENGDLVAQNFIQLVRQRFLERCPLPEPLVPPRQVTDTARKAIKGGHRNRAIVEAEGYFVSETERLLQLAEAGEKDRFRIPQSLGEIADQDSQWGFLEDAITEGTLSGAVPGSKRKRGADILFSGDSADAEVKEVLWRVNFSEFLRHFRHKVCTSVVRDKFDLSCSTLLSLWLSHGRSEESLLQQPFSSLRSLEALSDIARSSPEGCALTLERLRASLQQMASDPSGLLIKSSHLGAPQYSVDLAQLVRAAQLKEVEAVVSQRFGPSACRVFRLLQRKRCMEQKQVAELAMLPVQEAREVLYRMLKDGYVTLQEVAKTADHAPTRTFYLWRVHLPSVLRGVLDHSCQAASNLRHRLKAEMEQEQELLQLLERASASASASGGSSSAPAVQLTASQRQQLERIRRVAAVLEASLLRLDDVIMLFSSF